MAVWTTGVVLVVPHRRCLPQKSGYNSTPTLARGFSLAHAAAPRVREEKFPFWSSDQTSSCIASLSKRIPGLTFARGLMVTFVR